MSFRKQEWVIISFIEWKKNTPHWLGPLAFIGSGMDSIAM